MKPPRGGEYSNMSLISHLPEIGAGIVGRAVTDTLYVSPEGAGTNGKTWGGAFTTIPAALAVASTDGDDLTLINISPHATNYDIDITGDPTYTGNYILKGSHRNWAKITNTNADNGGATSILKFTGKVALIDLNFYLGTGLNGVIMTHGGVRVYNCQFVGEDLTGAATGLHLDHATGGKHAKVIDVDFKGDAEFMTALKIDQFGYSNFERLRIHSSLKGIHILGANSDQNIFSRVDIGDCDHANGIAIDIDAGNEQHFHDIIFHHNKKNVDDEVKDHIWGNIFGQFPIEILPADLDGHLVTAGDAASGIEADWGTAVVFAATDEIDYPFRIVAVHVEPTANEWHELRFSVDSGAIYYDRVLFKGQKREGVAAPSGTEFIFNARVELYCQMRSETGGNDCQVWIEIQKI